MRALLNLAGRLSNLTILERTVNGQPGLVVQQDGVIVTVAAFDVEGDQIKRIWGGTQSRQAPSVDGGARASGRQVMAFAGVVRMGRLVQQPAAS
ncbi:hypothetical protein ABT352_06675 [Streptosporangium sp. NPDC000563]|uniref:hypothetical protein n=1 Tax=Streptosporangium sp. NPDC000563 TaxID=3154366 RepID=UPI003318E0E3